MHEVFACVALRGAQAAIGFCSFRFADLAGLSEGR